MKRDFPSVELAELKWIEIVGKPAAATFIVVCKTAKAVPPKPAAKATNAPAK